MVYLESFTLPDSSTEEYYMEEFTKRTCYDTYYPFQIFYNSDLSPLEFEDITIFYGGNGSGKSTILNVIAEKLSLERDSVFNRSNFYDDYVKACRYFLMPGIGAIPEGSRIITSDDVFDHLLDVRCLNQNIDNRREELMKEYTELRYSNLRMKSLDDLDQLKKSNRAKSSSQSSFVRQNVMDNVRERSNLRFRQHTAYGERLDGAGCHARLLRIVYGISLEPFFCKIVPNRANLEKRCSAYTRRNMEKYAMYIYSLFSMLEGEQRIFMHRCFLLFLWFQRDVRHWVSC